MLAENLARIRQRIHQACQRCGRDPHAVTLVCVTKTIPSEIIRQALALGVTDIGENRVQEARAKQAELTASPKSIRWHMVGHLQRNKAKDAVELFEVVHSVDSVVLAEALEQQLEKREQGAGSREQAKRFVEVFLQVNVSGEMTKFGCRPDDVEVLAHRVTELPHLRLSGLMTMPPLSDNPEDARPHFRRLRELRDALQQYVHSALPIPHSPLLLSMGMSNDCEVAIEEGADLVRIGTAIFKSE
ncbi:MAG: YggS family pyridoxal phosphate-dependent enzyme [Candidatus Omnitrophica bacterium]|nr:YggS family pyridoxal phosphate-dependent enzyme [Candidatus Omnitrophota bacterium]